MDVDVTEVRRHLMRCGHLTGRVICSIETTELMSVAGQAWALVMVGAALEMSEDTGPAGWSVLFRMMARWIAALQECGADESLSEGERFRAQAMTSLASASSTFWVVLHPEFIEEFSAVEPELEETYERAVHAVSLFERAEAERN